MVQYAMSVMEGRALPDIRDGLKPVHRRILYAMSDLGLDYSKPFRKSARVVGEVLGKYHPHGDQAVYDSLVRMAQPFAMAECLVDGHGNFGSIDNDPAAAMRCALLPLHTLHGRVVLHRVFFSRVPCDDKGRSMCAFRYTECRLKRLSQEVLLADLDPAVVDFTPNFDGSCGEPSVLPARIPQLLVNGSQGIAVGIATKIPPHNLIEVVAAMKALIEDPSLSSKALHAYMPGPDFPTGGMLLSGPGIENVYTIGKGAMTVRSKVEVEEGQGRGSRDVIVVTELPYQVYKARVISDIAELVDKGTLDGIADIQDESDRRGMRIAIEVKRSADTSVVLNNLMAHTCLQSRFSANMVALVKHKPQQMNLKQMLQEFIDFRVEVWQSCVHLTSWGLVVSWSTWAVPLRHSVQHEEPRTALLLSQHVTPPHKHS
jgi:DNA gyrase subunit A